MTQGGARPGRLRILGLSEGDDRRAMSGVPGHLFDALDRRFAVVDRIDYSPRGVRRFALAAACFRPSRAAWRARWHTSPLAHRTLTSALRARVAEAPEFDVAVQVHGWVAGQPEPYTLFIDQTRLMADRGWPSWIPLAPRERKEILALERSMYARAAHVFTMGEPSRVSLVDDYDVDPARITVAGGGLNLPALPEVQDGLVPGRRILFVGRDFERKGGDVLLRAFALVRREVPDAELHIAGAQRTFDEPGVIGHGLVGREDLERLYRGARAFCMPSLYEPYGLVFAEAMSYGVPCVGSKVQSIPEILDDGRAGLLVEPGDAEGLAAALAELLTDDSLVRDLRASGRRLVQTTHNWDHVAHRMAPALEAVAAAAGA